MSERTVLTSQNVHEAEETRKESENLKLILLFSFLLFILCPPIFILPILMSALWKKDYRKIPPMRKRDKRRVWVFVFLLTSISLSSFLIFPYAKEYMGDFMFWSVYYPISSPTTDIILNSILFIITGVALPVGIAIPLRRALNNKYGEEKIDENSLLIPTKSGNIIIDRINTGLMVLGSPGSGKTELIKQIIYQLLNYSLLPLLGREGNRENNSLHPFLLRKGNKEERDYVWVIFDPKGDYYREFGNKDDIVLSVNNSNYGWNLFREIEPERVATDIMEMAKEIFQARKGGEDKFWMMTSQQLFAAFVTVLYREAKKSREILPTNEEFRDFINQLTIENAYNLLIQHKDLKSVAEYINPKAMKQASGVWSNFYSHMNEIFIGDFYKTSNKKQMSIREYVENPHGRKLFIEYNVETGEAVSPIFRLLIDRAIKYSFSSRNQYGKDKKPRKKFFIIDEFQLIPQLKRYQELVNFGRSYFITSIIGIQSIAQVIEKYNKDLTNAIVAGHAYLFALRSYDKESTDLIRNRIGKKMAWQREATSKIVDGHSTYAGDRYSMVEYSPISEEHIRTMKPGECIIVTPNGYREVKLYMFREAKKIMDESFNQ